MEKTALAGVALVTLVSLLALAGCPQEQETELQGAPTGTHTMPDGTQMPESEMPPTHTMPDGTPMPDNEMAPAAGAEVPDEETATCLVTGETMPRDKMIAYEHEGTTYYFCCAPCVEKFKQDPEKWIRQTAP